VYALILSLKMNSLNQGRLVIFRLNATKTRICPVDLLGSEMGSGAAGNAKKTFPLANLHVSQTHSYPSPGDLHIKIAIIFFTQGFVCRFSYVPVQLCAGAVMCRCSYVQVQLCVGAVMCRFSYVQVQLCAVSIMCRFSYVQVQLCSGSVMCRCSYVQIQLCAGSVMCSFNYVQVQLCVGSVMFSFSYV
jgi:hypothetical protein